MTFTPGTEPTHPESRRQLTALAEIARAFAAAKIPFWLFGGWAVDFAAGRISREHDDIDLVVFADGLPPVVRLLEDLSYESTSSKQVHQTNFRRDGIRIQLNLVERRPDGSIVSPGTFSDWPWRPGSFGTQVGRIGDLEVPIVSVEGQLEAKEGFPRHPAGHAHRAKDLVDIGVLRHILSSAAYTKLGKDT